MNHQTPPDIVRRGFLKCYYKLRCFDCVVQKVTGRMGKMEKSSRFHCDAKCTFIFHGFDYEGVIENVSLSGALIKLNNEFPDGMQPGDKCSLTLSGEPDSSAVKYVCKVIRIDGASIGVQFLEID